MVWDVTGYGDTSTSSGPTRRGEPSIHCRTLHVYQSQPISVSFTNTVFKLSAAFPDPLSQRPRGKSLSRPLLLSVQLALGDRRVALLAVSLLVASIAFTDWLLIPNVALGFLYFFALVLGAHLLERREIAVFAVICAILNEEFAPGPGGGDAVPRIAITLIAYLGVGLLVFEMDRYQKSVHAHAGIVAGEIQRREHAEQQLGSLVEGSPAAILTLDREGTVILANDAAHELLGFESQTLPGQTVDEYLPVLATLRHTSRVRHLIRTMIECTGSRRNGETFLAHIWVSSFGPPAATGLTAVVFDSSQQLRDREEEGLHTLATSTRVIMGAFWHETRNLCTAMRVTASSMKRIPGLTDTEELEALNSLVAGLEKLASAELSPESERGFECASLRAVLDHLRIVIEPGFQESGIRTVWQIADNVPVVRADHHGVLQVFLNLTRNARRVLETSERKEVAIHASVEKGSILVRFYNSGPPVPDPGHLFEPFRPEATGLGIGLYVSRAIVRSFGGDLRYEPVSHGVCFTVVLERGGSAFFG